MSASLTIKGIPDDVLECLRERAKRNRRSMQGEVLTILEDTLKPRRITIEELSRRVEESGLRTPSESVQMIREDRDAR